MQNAVRFMCGIALASAAGAASAQCQPEWTTFPTGTGLGGTVNALASHDGVLYVGGAFTSAGGVPVGRIALWDGQSWLPVGDGLSSTVNAMAVFEGALVVGGAFSSAGGQPAEHLASWDGSSWSDIGGGTSNSVTALAVFDGGLYVGGIFDQVGGAGGIEALRIARWDGSGGGGWSTLGGGMTGTGFNPGVFALTTMDDGSGEALFAGGGFIFADGVQVNRVAKWDGSSWSPLGTGVGATNFVLVRALAEFNGRLYAAGGFTEIGGVSANRIAVWNGSSWAALGSGTSGEVHALEVFDDGGGGGAALYVAGIFTTAGGVSASRIARWDGGMWSAVGAGSANNIAQALGAHEDNLWVGGTFSTMAGVTSQRIARWGGCPATPPCYANCDGSTTVPILTVDDFTCFINEFASAQSLPLQQQIEHYANCTGGSNPPPVLSIDDFTCFINEFAAGCP